MLQRFQSSSSSYPLTAERRSSSARPAHEAETDDIIGIFDTLDIRKNWTESLIGHVAANLDALLKFGPEEINVAAVVDRQVRVEASIKDISASVQHLASSQAVAEAVTITHQVTQRALFSRWWLLCNNSYVHYVSQRSFRSNDTRFTILLSVLTVIIIIGSNPYNWTLLIVTRISM